MTRNAEMAARIEAAAGPGPLTFGADGPAGGRVLQAFDAPGRARVAFG